MSERHLGITFSYEYGRKCNIAQKNIFFESEELQGKNWRKKSDLAVFRTSLSSHMVWEVENRFKKSYMIFCKVKSTVDY